MSVTTIDRVIARPIFDGCARRSLEVEVITKGGRGVAAPSYSDPRSSGKYEINHFPSGGVEASIGLINSVIDKRLHGFDAADQKGVDDALIALDDTPRFERIGGNTIEAVSMTVAKAAAASQNVPLYQHLSWNGNDEVVLPHLMLNIIGGGATMGDEGWRGRTPDLQDHLVVPVNCKSVIEEMTAISDVFHVVGSMIRDVDPNFAGGRDEEYCWIPNLDDETCMTILQSACVEVSRGKSYHFQLGIDIGASDLWSEEEQAYKYGRDGTRRSCKEQSQYVADLVERFDLFYVEDAFHEDHMELYQEQLAAFGARTLIVGDDLLATSEERLRRSLEYQAVNAAVVKLNMAGTVTQTRAFSDICHEEGVATVSASRTYDSPDDTMADLMVGWGSTGYKCGSPAGGEHVAKYNRLIRIQETETKRARMAKYPGPVPS